METKKLSPEQAAEFIDNFFVLEYEVCPIILSKFSLKISKTDIMLYIEENFWNRYLQLRKQVKALNQECDLISNILATLHPDLKTDKNIGKDFLLRRRYRHYIILPVTSKELSELSDLLTQTKQKFQQDQKEKAILSKKIFSLKQILFHLEKN